MSQKLGSMGAPIDESLLAIRSLESFGHRPKSSFGSAFPALLTKDELTYQSVSMPLLQTFVSQQSSKLSDELVKEMDFIVQPKKDKNKKIKVNIYENGVKCWYFGKIGPVKANFYKRKRDRGKKDAKKDRDDSVLVDLTQQNLRPRIWRSL